VRQCALWLGLLGLGWGLLGSCQPAEAQGKAKKPAQAAAKKPAQTLLQARRGFKTKLRRVLRDKTKLAPPPPSVFSLIQYKTPLGPMAAYLSRPARPGKKHAAILWVTGGFPPGGIGEGAWRPTARSNDQSAKAYRHAGLIMMYPTFRGTAGNPGSQETFYGEVDDLLAAADHLRKLDFVDPERVFLGGHSTGGTLVLLAAAAGGERFRGVISFGPVAQVQGYGEDNLSYHPSAREHRLRNPISFLAAIRCPTYVIEGDQGGNLSSLREMQAKNKNPLVRFVPVPGASHFDLLAPLNDAISRTIVTLKSKASFSLKAKSLQGAFNADQVAAREAADLNTLARIRRAGISLGEHTIQHLLVARHKAPLSALAKEATGFLASPVRARKDRRGRAFFLLYLSRRLVLKDVDALFACSKVVAALARKHRVQHDGWDLK